MVLPWLQATEHLVGTLVSFSEKGKSRILVFKERHPLHQRGEGGEFQSFLSAVSIWCSILPVTHIERAPGRSSSLTLTSVSLKNKSTRTLLFEFYEYIEDK